MSRRRVILFILVSSFAIWWFGRPLAEVYRRMERIESLKNEVTSLEEQKDKLALNLEYFKSLDFVEKESRNRLNFSKPGEKVLIIPNSQRKVLGEKGNIDEGQPVPNWRQWQRKFFN